MARNTTGLKPPVRTTEEARALAALPRGPRFGRELRSATFRLYADQLDELRARGLNASEVIRDLLDAHLAEQTD